MAARGQGCLANILAVGRGPCQLSLMSVNGDPASFVMAGHSRSKNGVASLAYVPAISIHEARCHDNRDHRHYAGDDNFRHC